MTKWSLSQKKCIDHLAFENQSMQFPITKKKEQEYSKVITIVFPYLKSTKHIQILSYFRIEMFKWSLKGTTLAKL